MISVDNGLNLENTSKNFNEGLRDIYSAFKEVGQELRKDLSKGWESLKSLSSLIYENVFSSKEKMFFNENKESFHGLELASPGISKEVLVSPLLTAVFSGSRAVFAAGDTVFEDAFFHRHHNTLNELPGYIALDANRTGKLFVNVLATVEVIQEDPYLLDKYKVLQETEGTQQEVVRKLLTEVVSLGFNANNSELDENSSSFARLLGYPEEAILQYQRYQVLRRSISSQMPQIDNKSRFEPIYDEVNYPEVVAIMNRGKTVLLPKDVPSNKSAYGYRVERDPKFKGITPEEVAMVKNIYISECGLQDSKELDEYVKMSLERRRFNKDGRTYAWYSDSPAEIPEYKKLRYSNFYNFLLSES